MRTVHRVFSGQLYVQRKPPEIVDLVFWQKLAKNFKKLVFCASHMDRPCIKKYRIWNKRPLVLFHRRTYPFIQRAAPRGSFPGRAARSWAAPADPPIQLSLATLTG